VPAPAAPMGTATPLTAGIVKGQWDYCSGVGHADPLHVQHPHPWPGVAGPADDLHPIENVTVIPDWGDAASSE